MNVLDLSVTVLCSGALVMAAVTLPWLHMGSAKTIGTVALLTALYVLAFRTEFESSNGSLVATQPVLVALLLCAPLGWAPAAVAVGVYFGTRGDLPALPLRFSLVRLAQGAHCLGPVAVFWATGTSYHHWSWPVVLLAFAAQVAIDLSAAIARGIAHEQDLREMLTMFTWAVGMDALLTILGVAIVSVAGGSFPGLLLLGVPIALVWMLAQDRQAKYEEAKTLESAFSEVKDQARLDPLTGLANRRAWEERLAAAGDVDGGPLGERTVTVLLADLDHLKLANDTFGHEAGDRLLVELAYVLTEASPDDATVARLGGDEFGVLVVGEPGQTPPDLVSAVQGLLAVHVAHTADTSPVTLSTSLGQASTPPCRTVAEAVSRADHSARLDKFLRRARRQDVELSR